MELKLSVPSLKKNKILPLAACYANQDLFSLDQAICGGQAWCCTPVLLVLRRPRQEDLMVKSFLDSAR